MIVTSINLYYEVMVWKIEIIPASYLFHLILVFEVYTKRLEEVLSEPYLKL